MNKAQRIIMIIGLLGLLGLLIYPPIVEVLDLGTRGKFITSTGWNIIFFLSGDERINFPILIVEILAICIFVMVFMIVFGPKKGERDK